MNAALNALRWVVMSILGPIHLGAWRRLLAKAAILSLWIPAIVPVVLAAAEKPIGSFGFIFAAAVAWAAQLAFVVVLARRRMAGETRKLWDLYLREHPAPLSQRARIWVAVAAGVMALVLLLASGLKIGWIVVLFPVSYLIIAAAHASRNRPSNIQTLEQELAEEP